MPIIIGDFIFFPGLEIVIVFSCSTFEEHQGIVFNVLWEMVVSSNVNMKTNAATLLKVLVCLQLPAT